MAGYYLKGLLNTATAGDSYCTYGYTSTTDKRNFCAVRKTDPFYASIRGSAYIHIFIYTNNYNGIENFKQIDYTNTEVSCGYGNRQTSDPNVINITPIEFTSGYSLWSNLHGSEVTLNDFISNAPILNGVGLSDAECDALAIQYLNNVPEPGQGQGTVMLDIKPPAQKLTFTSLLYGKSITKWIYQDDIVDFNIDEAASKWEILFQAARYAGDVPDKGSLLVNSDFDIITTQTCNAKFDGTLLKQAANSYAVKSDKIIEARYGNCSGINGTWNTYAKDAVINDNSPGNVPPTGTYGICTKLIIAKLSNVTLDFEFAAISSGPNLSYYWEYSIMKRNGTFIPGGGNVSGGVTITGGYFSVTRSDNGAVLTMNSFLGKIKVIHNGEISMYENLEEATTIDINGGLALAFAIPTEGPKKAVIGNLSTYDRDFSERLNGVVVNTAVPKVASVPRICLVQWHLTDTGGDGHSVALSFIGDRNYPGTSYGAYGSGAAIISEDDTRSTLDIGAWCEWWWYSGHVDVYHRWLTLPKGSSCNTNKVEGIFLNQESLQEYVSLQIEAGTYILTGNVWQNEQSYTASQIELRDDDGNVLCQSCRYTNQTTNNLVYTIVEFSTATTIHAYADTSRGSWLSGVEVRAIKIAL